MIRWGGPSLYLDKHRKTAVLYLIAEALVFLPLNCVPGIVQYSAVQFAQPQLTHRASVRLGPNHCISTDRLGISAVTAGDGDKRNSFSLFNRINQCAEQLFLHFSRNFHLRRPAKFSADLWQS